jgi:hypothetical protein
MIYVFYFVVGLYGVSFFGGLAVSWLIQRFGTFGSEHGYTNLKPPQNSQ